MLFNSFLFVLGFLPVVAVGFFVLCRYRRARLAAGWLTLLSLVFYGWWNPKYTILLIASILFNYCCAVAIEKLHGSPKLTKRILVAGVAGDLICLGYFKYFNFFQHTARDLLHVDVQLAQVILPIGISFFTFTQIAFLVDTYIGKVRERSFMNYSLFVTYFPHLIAGPVLHHSEMMPQFADPRSYRFSYDNVCFGLTYFLVGLSKKVLFADSIAPFVDHAFASSAPLSFSEAWQGAWGYALQIYFDFSGYSDMAIGLSKIFNVTLPLNFNSPYQATSIIDFWRRWHMTLSRFLRDYLYIPLGGNRRGSFRRLVNLMLTMLLGGLWHGAGWTFVIWGGLHGLYLTVNHGWSALDLPAYLRTGSRHAVVAAAGAVLTFLAVVIAWVFFRSTDLHQALTILASMAGASGFTAQHPHYEVAEGLLPWLGSSSTFWILALSLLAWFTPNSQRMMARLWESRSAGIIVRNAALCVPLITIGYILIVFCVSIDEVRSASSPFIYFNF